MSRERRGSGDVTSAATAPVTQVFPGNHHEAKAHSAQDSTKRQVRSVTGTYLARYAFTFAALAAFLCLIAAVGLVVELLAGVGALALAAGVFVVALMVAARAEGLI